MKKFLLSFGVITFFALYVLQQRAEEAGIVVTPPSLSPTPIPTQETGQGPVLPTTSSSASGPTPTSVATGQYKDGTYTGSVADAFYGNIQVQAIIQGGKITDVQFLQFPNDRGTSIMINSQAMPYLKQEAIAAQNANVDIVSGATDSSMAFRQSLQAALAQAH